MIDWDKVRHISEGDGASQAPSSTNEKKASGIDWDNVRHINDGPSSAELPSVGFADFKRSEDTFSGNKAVESNYNFNQVPSLSDLGIKAVQTSVKEQSNYDFNKVPTLADLGIEKPEPTNEVREQVKQIAIQNIAKKYSDIPNYNNLPEYRQEVESLAKAFPEVMSNPLPNAQPFYNPESTKNAGSYLVEKAKSGLIGAAEGLENARTIGESRPDIKTARELIPDRNVQSRQEFAQAEAENVSPFLRGLGGVTEAISRMVPSIALGAIGGAPAIGTTFLGASAAGNARQEALSQGATDEQASAYGLLIGSIEGATESLVGGIPFLNGVSDKLISKLTSPIKNKIAKSIVNGIISSGGEGVEEVISGFLEPYAKRATYDKNAENKKVSELATDFAMGAIVSGILQLPATSLNLYADSKQGYDINNQASIASDTAKAMGEEYQSNQMATETPVEKMDTDKKMELILQTKKDLQEYTENKLDELSQGVAEIKPVESVELQNTEGNIISRVENKTALNGLQDENKQTDTLTPKEGITPMSKRTVVSGVEGSVGDRNIKSYQFENPEVKPYFQSYANYILNNEFVPNAQLDRETNVMRMLKEDTGLTPKDIKNALERLINNHGQENVAAAKRVEIVIDDMLTNGFDSVTGERFPPDVDYLSTKSKIEGEVIQPKNNSSTLDDIPVINKTAKPAETIQDTDQIGIAGINTRTIKGNDGESNKILSPYGQAWKDAQGNWNVQLNEQDKATIVNSEREAMAIIDSGMERTEAKAKNETENSEQQSMFDSLPNDVKGLREVISNMEQQAKIEKDEQKLLKINLQLFAAKEKLQELSKFRINTLTKTANLQGEEMQKMIDEIDMTYGVKTHEETIQKAQDMVNSDMQETMDRIKKNGLESAEDTAAAFLIQKELQEEAKKTGDYSKLKSWLKTVQVSGTKQGQTIEAFKIWQEDPDGMLKNATKVVEDAENAEKKKNPGKMKQIDDETNKVIDDLDKTERDAADQIQDEVNKKADEIIKNKPKTESKESDGKKPKEPKEKEAEEELNPSDILANKIQNYIKDVQPKKDDPVMNMVNELFRVAKESPIDREKIKSKSAIEFVAESIENRQQFVDTWVKAKSIVRENVKDNPEALAKLEAYFDKGIRPPFSSASFEKSIREGMKDLKQNLGEIVKDYYAIGSKSRKELIDYLVAKSGLEKQDAEVLAKYVNNRMKELTKAKKEHILKGIFKKQTVKESKPGALKSVEELSNIGAFVNDNYKDKVMEKLSPRLQRVINEQFKGVPTKQSAATGINDGRIDFGELVRKSTTEIDFTRVKFLKEISEKLQVNDKDAKTILTAIEQRFNEIVDEKRASILGNMFKKREPAVKKTGLQRVQEYIDKQVELENLGAQEDAIRDFIKEKYGLPTLTNDDMAFITDNIEQLKKLEEGSRPYNETLWKIYNRIESKVPSTFIDKFRAWQRISMLPNIKTFTRNILGNVFMEKAENFNELTTTALVDWIASSVTGKRTVLGPTAAIQKSIAQTKGKVQGLTDTLIDIKHGVNTYDVQGQYEINVSKNAFKNPALNALEQFTNRSLQFGDRPFYEAAKARRIEELKKINKAKTVTEEMEADATLYALDRTFQNDSFLAGKIQQFKTGKAGQQRSQVYEAIANIVIPFAKTPANILDKISDYTPIGLVKAVGHLGKTAGKGSTFNQQYFSQRLGRMLTGTGLIILGYILADKDIITGKSDKTTSKKGAFDKETGKLGYALKLGNEYIAYDWMQPIGSLLALGADAYNQGMNKGDILKGVEGAGNTFFNMSMLQSLNSLMSYGNPAGGFIKTMLDSNQQFTPTGLKQVAKAFDKYERDTTGENYWEETANKFKASLPGLRQTLPAKTDTFGNKIEVQEGYGPLQKVINIVANPAYVTKSTMKDYEKEMYRLYNMDLGLKVKSDVLPSILQKTISDGKGNEYELTTEQYNKYKKTYGDIAVNGLRDDRGNIIRNGLDTVIRSADYKQLTDKDKAKRVNTILSKAADTAKDKILKELKAQK